MRHVHTRKEHSGMRSGEQRRRARVRDGVVDGLAPRAFECVGGVWVVWE